MTPSELIAYIREQTAPKTVSEKTGLAYGSATNITGGFTRGSRRTNEKLKTHLREILQVIIDNL